MPVRIKMCGMTRYEDVRVATTLGVDAVGFIFCRQSKRCIAPEDVRAIVERMPPFVAKVGVFVDESVSDVLGVIAQTGIDTVQLHGDESPDYCRQMPVAVIKTFRVGAGNPPANLDEYPVAGLMLDTWDENAKGGTGKTFDWALAKRICQVHDNVILSGGLGPTNVQEALDVVRPYGVDLNSGVEVKPGVKNPHKMHEAVRIIRNWK